MPIPPFNPTCDEIVPNTPLALICCRQASRETPLQTNPDFDLDASVAVLTPAVLSSGSTSTLAVRAMAPTLFVTFALDGPLTFGFSNAKRISAFWASRQPNFPALNVGLYGVSVHPVSARLN